MISVEEIINDPDFAQLFIIHRKEGSWIEGVWTPYAHTRKIPCYGPVIAANAKEINQVPEGDRVAGIMVFYTPKNIPMVTSHVDPGTSDEILWQREWYKIVMVNAYDKYGFWKGMGKRIEGA